MKMLEANISGDLSDFDVKHFCDGDPNHCYYFRLTQLQKTKENPTEAEQKILPLLTLNNEKNHSHP
jgi:hypothetical protein